jgi:hypothetical protein
MSLSDPYALDDRQSSTAIRRVVLAAMQVQSDLTHLGSNYPGNVLGCRKFDSDEIAKKMRAFAISEAQLKLAIDCTSEEDLGLPADAWETDPQACTTYITCLFCLFRMLLSICSASDSLITSVLTIPLVCSGSKQRPCTKTNLFQCVYLSCHRTKLFHFTIILA